MKRLLELTGPRGIDFLLALACGLSLVFLQFTSLFQPIEWFAFDKLTQETAQTRPLDPSLAVVAIDDYSIQQMSLPPEQWPWPWPHKAYAGLIAYLKASGAKEIWIDLTFYTPDPMDAMQDNEVKAVAQAAGNVHFGQGEEAHSIFTPTFQVSLPHDESVLAIHTDDSGQHLLAWPPSFNTLRQQPGSPIYSALLMVAEGSKLIHSLPVDDRTDPAKLSSLWKGGTVPPFGEHFKGKIVYVGVSAQAGYDLKAFSIGKREPSVMIHIVARSNEIQRGYFQTIPAALRVMVTLLCCLLVSELFGRTQSFSLHTAYLLGLIGLITLLAYLFFLHRYWVAPMVYYFAVTITFTMITVVNYLREGKKRRVTAELFGKFVSKKIVDRLIARPDQLKLGGERAELSVFFSDLSGFTTLSEKMTSDVLLTMLNTYLNEMSELIYEQEGTLDKYIGDAVMAFWGAPDYSPDHAWRACHAALACHKRLAELSPIWEKTYGVVLSARIGINTDEMTVGMVGSNRLHNYSVIGDAVNLASRLEGANKPFGTSIMIAQRTVDLAQGKIEVRPIALLQVKGKTKPVQVYELLAKAGELTDKQSEAQSLFTEAFLAFTHREWDKAEGLLVELIARQPEDELARLYLKRVREYIVSPPGPEWEGIFKLDDK